MTWMTVFLTSKRSVHLRRGDAEGQDASMEIPETKYTKTASTGS